MTASPGICGRHLEAQVFCRECVEGIRTEGRVKGREDREDDVTAAFARGRVAGIREAIAECTELFRQGAMAGHMLLALEALLHNAKHPSPTSGGEKAECTCRIVLTYPDALHANCPVHAPKPAAEKP